MKSMEEKIKEFVQEDPVIKGSTKMISRLVTAVCAMILGVILLGGSLITVGLFWTVVKWAWGI